ncbi:BREX protein BrxB domain-containing protein [Methanoculleus bourgensis]|nr:BREX protein BrxB domain-containing protein [Methanoculleus bourgensis]
MSKIDDLLEVYRTQVSLQWNEMLSGQEKVWFCVYDPSYERRIRARLSEFKIVTVQSGHTWQEVDITGLFENWLAGNEYREDFFTDPSLLRYDLDDFVARLADHLTEKIRSAENSTVVAVIGIGSLYGIVRASAVIDRLVRSTDIPGRLMFFFPGDRDRRNYRLLKARDGWSYLATPIEA